MKTLGKIESLFWIAVGGLGWVLQSKGQTTAVLLAVAIATAGTVGLLSWAVLMVRGGHQAPRLTATLGHLLPSLLRAALLAGLGWLGGLAASKAGVKTEELAGLISVIVFTFVTETIKEVEKALDTLRPAAFGKKSIRRVYGKQFDVQPGEKNIAKVNARNAVHSDPLQIVGTTGEVTDNVYGWKLDARRKRLKLIATASALQ